MGTSSMYLGPNRNPLLPRDFDESGDSTPNQTEPDQNNAPKTDDKNGKDNQGEEGNNTNSGNSSSQNSGWQHAKNFMSRYASGSSNNRKGAVSSYVKAHGGARNAAKSAQSGVKSTINVGKFITSITNQGIRETLNQAKIEFEGKSASEILNEVINLLAPIPITKEDSVARKATIRTLEILYEKIDDDNNDISTLEKIDIKILNEIIPVQIQSYIYERIINDLGSRIEGNSQSASDAISKENDIKEYINAKVEVTMKGRDFSKIDFNASSINKEVESLFNQCYKVMEDML